MHIFHYTHNITLIISSVTQLNNTNNRYSHKLQFNPMVKRGQLPFFLSLLLLTIRSLSLCLQWLNNSCLLLSVAFSGLNMMCHFSLVHRLQTPVDDEKGAARQTTSQLTSGSSCLSCRFHMCPASVYFVLSSDLLKFCLCPPNRCLKVLAVSPTYFSSELVPVAATVAL